MIEFFEILGLLVLALLLLTAEPIIPSFGLLTLCSLAAAGGAVYIAFGAGTFYGYLTLTLFVFFAPICVWGGFKLLPHTPFVLRDKIDGHAKQPGLERLLGSSGQTATRLNPVGKVRIGDTIYNARSDHELIDRGVAVVVVDVRAGELIVNTEK